MLMYAKTLYICPSLVPLGPILFLYDTVIVRNCTLMLSQDNRSAKLPTTYLAGISVDFIHETSQFTAFIALAGNPSKNYSQRKC